MAYEIAFFGLGNLGRAIVKRMKEALPNINFYLWTQDVSRAELFSSEIRAIRIIKPEKIQKDIRYIFLCLFDSSAVQNILEKIPKEGKVIVDLTTNHPKKVLEFREIVEKNKGEYIESPVLGSVIPASQGKLTLLVCGKEKIFNEVKTFLESISSKIFYFGENFSQASYKQSCSCRVHDGSLGSSSSRRNIRVLFRNSFRCSILRSWKIGNFREQKRKAN
jgi:3-hydroxyisobutyrate dehydrogenase